MNKLSDEEIKKLAHEEMLDYVDMGGFQDWKFALILLEEGFYFGYLKAMNDHE